jgi:hypothetical protein
MVTPSKKYLNKENLSKRFDSKRKRNSFAMLFCAVIVITIFKVMDRSMSFKEVRDVECSTSESSLSSIFFDNNVECLNQANIEVVESQRQAA